MTWPMAIRLSSPYAKIWQDFGLWLWNLWWMKKALVDLGTSPYFSSYIFHPTGTGLVFHNLSPYNGLIGIPLQLLGADVITTYNLLYLSSFVIGGVGMFFLVRELTGNTVAGFLAGAVYAFSPFRTAVYGYTNLWATQWLPIALLFVVRLLRLGRRLDGVGLAIALTLATLSDWHQPVFLLLMAMVLSFSVVFSRHQTALVRRGVVGRLAWSLLLYILLISPLAYIVAREFAAGDTLLQTPSWFKGLGLLGYRGSGGDWVSYGVILGWIPVTLVGYGIVRGLDFWMRRFIALLAVFFMLSLGDGLRLPGMVDPVMPLPFVLWRKIPVLGIIRGSIYFWIVVQVCFAVLAGHGAKRLWERMEERWPEKVFLRRIVVGAGLAGLILVEVLHVPFTPRPIPVNPAYDAIRHEPSGSAVLDAPVGYSLDTPRIHAGRAMFLQTYHGHPIVGANTQFDTRRRLAFLERHPVLRVFVDYWEPREEDIPEGAAQELRSFLSRYRIGWVMLRKGMRDAACDRAKTRTAGWSSQKFLNLVAPAVVNREFRAIGRDLVLYYCSDWDAARARKADALVRQVLGPPVWDDAELSAYRVK